MKARRRGAGRHRMTEDQILLRRYLLGELDDDAQRLVEERLFTSQEYFDEMLMGEDELIDGYVRGSLSPGEVEAFKSHFLLTPERRVKLRFALSLKRYVAASGAEASAAPEAVETADASASAEGDGLWARLKAFLRGLRPAVYAPLAAALLLLVAYGSWQLVVGRRQQQGRAALEAELAELNRPPRGTEADPAASPPAGVAVFTLSPGLVRGAGDSREVAPAEGARVVQLRLDLPSDDFQSYQAVLQTGADEPGLTVKDLRARGEASYRFVILNLPARLLADGEYRLALKGSAEGVAAEEVAAYHFRVRRTQ
jgi:hypothetical protein